MKQYRVSLENNNINLTANFVDFTTAFEYYMKNIPEYDKGYLMDNSTGELYSYFDNDHGFSFWCASELLA